VPAFRTFSPQVGRLLADHDRGAVVLLEVMRGLTRGLSRAALRHRRPCAEDRRRARL